MLPTAPVNSKLFKARSCALFLLWCSPYCSMLCTQWGPQMLPILLNALHTVGIPELSLTDGCHESFHGLMNQWATEWRHHTQHSSSPPKSGQKAKSHPRCHDDLIMTHYLFTSLFRRTSVCSLGSLLDMLYIGPPRVAWEWENSLEERSHRGDGSCIMWSLVTVTNSG